VELQQSPVLTLVSDTQVLRVLALMGQPRDARLTPGLAQYYLGGLHSSYVRGLSLTPYAALARDMGTSEGALKVAVHRLRKRYRDLLRQEIAETVADATEVESELRYLAAALTQK
jgi:hypothetical protein